MRGRSDCTALTTTSATLSADADIAREALPVARAIADGLIGDITSRRGSVQGLTQRNGAQQIDCSVPLSEMFGYATNLRSRTQGRGQFTMEPSHYIELPKSLTEGIVSKRKGN